MDRVIYLDCFSGISGDMFLGALFDLGLRPEELLDRLTALSKEDIRISAHKVTHSGIGATSAQIHLGDSHHHRYLPDILELIQKCSLPPSAAEKASRVFTRLAEAEAAVHRTTPCKVHFHEVGALDAIVDIAGTCLGLHLLGVQKVVCSPLPLGKGWVSCSHGQLPLPAPAVLELLKNIPVYGSSEHRELVTPTGAALAVELASSFGPFPPLQIQKIGYGAGKKQGLPYPNYLRLLLGNSREEGGREASSLEKVGVLECAIDDMNPQLYDHIRELLLQKGAHDVLLIPVQMKKNRPGTLLSITCPPPKIQELAFVVFKESTTLGLRYRLEERLKAERKIIQVDTPWGAVRVKYGYYAYPTGADQAYNLAPEYDDCLRIARQQSIPLKVVQEKALSLASKIVSRETI